MINRSHYNAISEQSPGPMECGLVDIWNLSVQGHSGCWHRISLLLPSSFPAILLSLSFPHLSLFLSPCLPVSSLLPSLFSSVLFSPSLSCLPSLPCPVLLLLDPSLSLSLLPLLLFSHFFMLLLSLFACCTHPVSSDKAATMKLSCWETRAAMERSSHP